MNYGADVVTISMCASRGEWEDTSGPEIVNFLREIGLTSSVPKVMADGEIVATASRTACPRRPYLERLRVSAKKL